MKTLHSGLIGTQTEIEAMTGAFEGMTAYATDLNRLGTYDGSQWNWMDPMAVSDISAKVYNDANLVIGTGEWTPLTFNSEEWDTDNIHDTGSNTDRLTCRTPGKYLVISQSTFAGHATGLRYLDISHSVDDVVAITNYNPRSTSIVLMECVAEVDMDVGDYVTTRVYQNSGGDLNINSTSAYSPRFSMHRIGGATEKDYVCDGRLTLTSGTPITTSDVTAATNVYFAPYKGDRVALYNGASWEIFEFTERTLSIAGYAADTNFDIFLYDNAGTLTLEAVAWTDATNRATALTTQNGVYVKSGDTTRRYLGTIRTTSTIGQCEDSETKRFVWNYYNQVSRYMLLSDDTDHTYGTTTWRYYNNDSSNKIEYVCGVVEDAYQLNLIGDVDANNYQAYTGVGFDNSSSGSFPRVNISNATRTACGSSRGLLSLLGYHYIALLQWAENSADWKAGYIFFKMSM